MPRLLCIVAGMLPGAAAWLPAMTADIPLPGPVSAVKWQHGRAVALAGTIDAPLLLVFQGTAGTRKIEPWRAAAGARRVEVIDFTTDREGTVHALLLAVMPVGRDRRLLCRFPEQGEASCGGLGEPRCRLLVAVGEGAAWCFGEGPAGMLLHRLGGPQSGPRFWLPAEGPLRGAAAARRASMHLASPGRIRLILPELSLAADVHLDNGETQWNRLPAPAGLSGLESFAVQGDRLLALLPLNTAAGAGLKQRYGLFELRGAWRRAAPERDWPRGARLAGAEGEAAWIWNRLERRIERVALPPP